MRSLGTPNRGEARDGPDQFGVPRAAVWPFVALSALSEIPARPLNRSVQAETVIHERKEGPPLVKALVLQAQGANPAMAVEDRPMPLVRPDTSLVRIHAATANPLSQMIRAGDVPMARPPLVLSNDGAGVVEESEVFEKGAHVAIYGGGELGITEDGLQQEFVVVENRRLIDVGGALTLDQASALPINYITAWQALTRAGGLQSGQYVLISGATGSVGRALMQCAEAMGAQPIALVSSDAKAKLAREAGMSQVISLEAGPLPEAIAELTGGQGVDLAVDPVGGPRLAGLLSALNPLGTLVSLGFIAGTTGTFDLPDLVVHEKRIRGYDAWLETDEAVSETVNHLIKHAKLGRIRPEIDSHFALEDHADAYARLTSGAASGAILLHP